MNSAGALHARYLQAEYFRLSIREGNKAAFIAAPFFAGTFCTAERADQKKQGGLFQGLPEQDPDRKDCIFSLQSRALNRIIVLRVGPCGSAVSRAHGFIHGERKTDFSGWASSFLFSVTTTVYRYSCPYSITKKVCGKKRHTCVAVIFMLRI